MAAQTLLLTCFSLLILSLHFFQTYHANPYCTPSACGVIRNIRYPFRLKNDPKNCGQITYQLACENNVTTIVLDYKKYHVKAINYHNFTIRVAEVSINNNICSFPKYSFYLTNFSTFGYPYSIYRDTDKTADHEVAWPINFMSCPYPLMNSSLLMKASSCGRGQNNVSNASSSSYGNGRYTYVKVGHTNVSALKVSCQVDLTVMTSWKFKDSNNVSLSEIHDSLLYGFELSWFNFDMDVALAGLKISWRVSLAAMIIVGLLICAPVLLLITNRTLLGYYSAVWFFLNPPIIVVLGYAARFIFGFSFLMWILIYKFRRRHMSMYEAIEGFLQRKLRSGLDVAVKMLGKSTTNGQDFINEIATIGRIHHVNVVKLVGYCAERSKRALVFDFMPNGSLEKYIFNPENLNVLNLDKKFDIAVGVARGIEYLHRGCDVQILHFDIKPHNILLDHNFIPKISDFGLAKFFSTEKKSVTLTAARGTIGYVTPELINRGIGVVSFKADVYSFGMLLIDIVGLKRDLITGNNNDSSKYFPYWIYDHINQGKEIEIENAGDNDNARRLVRKTIVVALWCIQMSPDDRPSMSKVLEMLEGDVEHLSIPDYPSQSTPIIVNVDQTGITCSTDFVSSLLHQDDASPNVEITVQE
ncbi:hypothetical protein C2S51_021866 [Perilla frutescens var. frutescens]|nr:hypothetical protein C2S51_021866 [Perilla frutescens var. frutescens]